MRCRGCIKMTHQLQSAPRVNTLIMMLLMMICLSSLMAHQISLSWLALRFVWPPGTALVLVKLLNQQMLIGRSWLQWIILFGHMVSCMTNKRRVGVLMMLMKLWTGQARTRIMVVMAKNQTMHKALPSVMVAYQIWKGVLIRKLQPWHKSQAHPLLMS